MSVELVLALLLVSFVVFWGARIAGRIVASSRQVKKLREQSSPGAGKSWTTPPVITSTTAVTPLGAVPMTMSIMCANCGYVFPGKVVVVPCPSCNNIDMPLAEELDPKKVEKDAKKAREKLRKIYKELNG